MNLLNKFEKLSNFEKIFTLLSSSIIITGIVVSLYTNPASFLKGSVGEDGFDPNVEHVSDQEFASFNKEITEYITQANNFHINATRKLSLLDQVVSIDTLGTKYAEFKAKKSLTSEDYIFLQVSDLTLRQAQSYISPYISQIEEQKNELGKFKEQAREWMAHLNPSADHHLNPDLDGVQSSLDDLFEAFTLYQITMSNLQVNTTELNKKPLEHTAQSVEDPFCQFFFHPLASDKVLVSIVKDPKQTYTARTNQFKDYGKIMLLPLTYNELPKRLDLEVSQNCSLPYSRRPDSGIIQLFQSLFATDLPNSPRVGELPAEEAEELEQAEELEESDLEEAEVSEEAEEAEESEQAEELEEAEVVENEGSTAKQVVSKYNGNLSTDKKEVEDDKSANIKNKETTVLPNIQQGEAISDLSSEVAVVDEELTETTSLDIALGEGSAQEQPEGDIIALEDSLVNSDQEEKENPKEELKELAPDRSSEEVAQVAEPIPLPIRVSKDETQEAPKRAVKVPTQNQGGAGASSSVSNKTQSTTAAQIDGCPANRTLYADLDDSHPTFKAVKFATDYGIFSGKPATNSKCRLNIIDLNTNFNRAEQLKVAIELYNKLIDANLAQNKYTAGFGNLGYADFNAQDPNNKWLLDYVFQGQKAQLFTGYSDKTLRLGSPVKEAEALKTFLIATGAVDAKVFTASHSPWYLPAYSVAKSKQLHYNSPERELTRQEVIKMIYALHQAGILK